MVTLVDLIREWIEDYPWLYLTSCNVCDGDISTKERKGSLPEAPPFICIFENKVRLSYFEGESICYISATDPQFFDKILSHMENHWNGII